MVYSTIVVVLYNTSTSVIVCVYIESCLYHMHALLPNPALVPPDVFTGGPSARAEEDSTGQGAATLCRAS